MVSVRSSPFWGLQNVYLHFCTCHSFAAQIKYSDLQLQLAFAGIKMWVQGLQANYPSRKEKGTHHGWKDTSLFLHFKPQCICKLWACFSFTEGVSTRWVSAQQARVWIYSTPVCRTLTGFVDIPDAAQQSKHSHSTLAVASECSSRAASWKAHCNNPVRREMWAQSNLRVTRGVLPLASVEAD